MTQFGPGVEILVADVAVAADGSIYLIGETDAAMPGNTIVGDTDGFLARFDPDGEEEWYLHIGTEEYDNASAVTVAGDRTVYISGDTTCSMPGNTSSGERDVIIADLTGSDGTRNGFRQYGESDGDDHAAGVTVAINGDVVIAATTQGYREPGYVKGGQATNLDVFVAVLGP